MTVALEPGQLAAIRDLVKAGKANSVSHFMRHAVSASLTDMADWETMLRVALEQTGGRLTVEERAWADSILGPRARLRRASLSR